MATRRGTTATIHRCKVVFLQPTIRVNATLEIVEEPLLFLRGENGVGVISKCEDGLCISLHCCSGAIFEGRNGVGAVIVGLV